MSSNRKVNLLKIKQLRKTAGYSLTDISTILGYESASGYFYLESGRCSFPAEKLAIVADLLKVNVNDLFFEE